MLGKIFKLTLLLVLSIGVTACAKTNSQEASSSSSSSSSKTHAIIVTIDGTDYRASLSDSQASRSLLERLPQELTFRDYSQGFDEKIADLDQGLDYGTESYDNDPEALDIGYWSPNQRLVFYYGDVEAYAGIHIMGQFESAKAKDAIQNLTTASTVMIRLADK